MNIIDFEEPEIKEELDKLFILEGESSLCNRLPNPRRFEELLYSICRVKIQGSGFDGFDSVSLMSGVRDKGRDCALFKNGKACGTIQCKKYASNYSKEEFGLEITKFALYSLLDERSAGMQAMPTR